MDISLSTLSIYISFLFFSISIFSLKRGANLTFISILRQSDIPNVLMPMNSPLSVDNLNLYEISSDNYPDSLAPPNLEIGQADIGNYENYWTFAFDQNMLYLAWVPFFTNCQSYGSKILWFDLLEYNQNCQLRNVEDTIIVEAIPTTGISPIADYCNLNLNCSFAEEVNQTTTLTKWWQISDKMTLYYIPSYGVSSNEYFTNRDGQTTYFSSLIDGNTDDMVPVIFSSENLNSNGYPSTVTLQLEYYQVTTTMKKLVKASVILSNFKNIDTSLHPYYTLNVVFTAMGFLDLINAFQFGIPIYLLAFILFSIFTTIGIMIFWGFNKVISKRENPPILKFGQTIKIVILPQIYVTFYLYLNLIQKFRGH